MDQLLCKPWLSRTEAATWNIATRQEMEQSDSDLLCQFLCRPGSSELNTSNLGYCVKTGHRDKREERLQSRCSSCCRLSMIWEQYS